MPVMYIDASLPHPGVKYLSPELAADLEWAERLVFCSECSAQGTVVYHTGEDCRPCVGCGLPFVDRDGDRALCDDCAARRA